MAAVQSLVGFSPRSSGIAGIPCQLSSRGSRQRFAERGRRGGGARRSLGEVSRIRGQAVAEEEEGGQGAEAGVVDDDFEARLSKLQRKVTSGAGKKAELRKARKEGGGDVYASSTSSKAQKDSLYIPPVTLKEPISGGLGVELGFTPYTERLNGRLAALGLAAVLLVELATGESFVTFHDSGTLIVQVYTVLGLTAIFVKYEKERISVWPKG